MRDISHKSNTLRTATAEASLTLDTNTLDRIRQRQIPKGDPLEIARAAAIQAAKNTSQIIPFCHQVPLAHVAVEFELGQTSIRIRATARAVYKTGVEMEALVAVSTAALTLYDMLKMLDRHMEIGAIRLLSKQGGKSDYAVTLPRRLRAGVLVVSDSCAAGTKKDVSGATIVERLVAEQIDMIGMKIVPDEIESIVIALTSCSSAQHPDLILTTGGTGLGPRDVTPEATVRVIEREVPGIAEAIRAFGAQRSLFAALSRGKAGLCGGCLIVNLPGSVRGVSESLDVLLPLLPHIFATLWGHKNAHPDPRGEET